MTSYQKIAPIYDYLMADIDYEIWFQHYMNLLGLSDTPQNIVEIGAGTGNFTFLLAEHFRVHAVDFSDSMLEFARNKALENPPSHHVSFECADMGAFQGNGELFDAAVSVFDVMNCMDSVEKLQQVFAHIALKLRKGGRFIFDMNTETAFKQHLFDEECERPEDGYSHVWRGYYDPETRLERIEMKYYRDGELDFCEYQIQRAHSREEIVRALENAGFERIQFYDAYTMQPPSDQSDRWIVAAAK